MKEFLSLDWSAFWPGTIRCWPISRHRRRLGGVIRAARIAIPVAVVKQRRRRHPAGPEQGQSREPGEQHAEGADEDLVVARDDPASRPDPGPDTQGTAITGHVGHQAEEHGELRHDSEHDGRDQPADVEAGVERDQAVEPPGRQQAARPRRPAAPRSSSIAESGRAASRWPGGAVAVRHARSGAGARPIPGNRATATSPS